MFSTFKDMPDGNTCTLPINTSNNLNWHSIVFIVGITIGLCIWLFVCESENQSVNSKHTPEFIESSTFIGRKPGYVFKTMNKKTGYYYES